MQLPIKCYLIFVLSIIYVSVVAQTNDSLYNFKDTAELKGVIIVSKKPIAERFSVTKIEKLDVYFNPISKGDPLNAIQILPASTNADETANPVMRGGSADRSRIYLNGSAIVNPVRNAQNTGLGNFSLLNTEIINKEYVYASNPPLNYSNASAGLVEIETNKNLDKNNIQVSIALSNLGMMLNKKINKKIFFQLYGNRQFSELLKKTNNKQLPDLQRFSSTDLGLNTRINVNENLSLNTFNYFISEIYASKGYYLNFKGNTEAEQKRFFSINNIDYWKGRSKIRFSSMYDYSNKAYQFGLINSRPVYNLLSSSLSHKYAASHSLTIQYGVDYLNQKYTFNETLPVYYFANNSDAPTHKNLDNLIFSYAEVYLFGDYKINSDFGISAGVRQNIYTSNEIKNFTSYQFSTFYNINKFNRFIFGMGNYNSYSTPNYIQHVIGQLNSQQIALDYYLEKKKYTVTVASFYKIDKGNYQNTNIEFFDKIKSLGFELSANYNFSKYLSFGFSNIYLDQNGFIGSKKYNTSSNLKYFIKSQLVYNNPKQFTASLALTTRPGNHYSNVTTAIFDTLAKNYQPFFFETNKETYKNYFRIDFTMNKVVNIKGNSLVLFFTVNNLLNTKNESFIYYNSDYSQGNFQYFQQRTFYLGTQFKLNRISK